MRITRILRGAAEAGWVQIPHRGCDYPELADVRMWRSSSSEVPQPILVLTGKNGLEKTGKICQGLTYNAGCVGVELPDLPHDAEWTPKQVDTLVKCINVLYCPWVHVICHSVGAIVGLELARRHPERVGTLTILDTPLVNSKVQREAALVESLMFCQDDPNVTDQEVEAVEKELAPMHLNKLLKAPVKDDETAFKELLVSKYFSPSFHTSISEVMHPMLLIRAQGKKSVIDNNDVGAWRDTFNVKGIRQIEADSHDDMLEKEYSNVALEIDTFLKGYTTQHLVETMWEDVKTRKLTAAAKMGMGTSGNDDKGGKKKEKKKKK